MVVGWLLVTLVELLAWRRIVTLEAALKPTPAATRRDPRMSSRRAADHGSATPPPDEETIVAPPAPTDEEPEEEGRGVLRRSDFVGRGPEAIAFAAAEERRVSRLAPLPSAAAAAGRRRAVAVARPEEPAGRE